MELLALYHIEWHKPEKVTSLMSHAWSAVKDISLEELLPLSHLPLTVFLDYTFTYVISLTSSPLEATSVATRILTVPVLKSSRACSRSHCSLKYVYHKNWDTRKIAVIILKLEQYHFTTKQLVQMSRVMTKPAKWHVCPAKPQISLGIHPVWSESSLSVWIKLESLVTH